MSPLSFSPLLSIEKLLCFAFACVSSYIIHQSRPTQSHTLAQFVYDKHCFIKHCKPPAIAHTYSDFKINSLVLRMLIYMRHLYKTVVLFSDLYCLPACLTAFPVIKMHFHFASFWSLNELVFSGTSSQIVSRCNQMFSTLRKVTFQNIY